MPATEFAPGNHLDPKKSVGTSSKLSCKCLNVCFILLIFAHLCVNLGVCIDFNKCDFSGRNVYLYLIIIVWDRGYPLSIWDSPAATKMLAITVV